MSDLYTRQAELEWDCVVLGERRHVETLKQGQSATTAGLVTLKAAIPALAEAIDTFVTEASTPGRAGRKHTALPYLLHVLPEQAAYLTLRYAIDGAAEGAGLSALALEIGAAIEDHINLTKLGEDAPGLYRKVMEQVKRATTARHRTGVLRHVVRKYTVDSLSWTKDDKLILGVKLVELLEASTNLITVRNMTEGRHQTRARVLFTPEAEAQFAEMNEREARWSPIHLPMLVPPRDWTTPFHGGYLTKAIRRAFMVQSHLPGALDEIKNADMPDVYSAVNAIQSTPWRINKPLLSIMREARAAGEKFQAMFVESDQPLPTRPIGVPADVPMDRLTIEQREELTAWKRAAADVYETNNRLRSKRIGVGQKLWVAEKFADETAIYFPHYLDFRGRIYPFASYLNPQSDDVGRALLEFASGKPLGDRGLSWLKVHVANLFGVDKVAFDERVRWVEDNLDDLLDSAMNPLDGRLKWTQADSPWCALAACMELAGALVAGPDYVSHLPIAMDGSCSGLQHYSAMLRDPVGGAAVNLVPGPKPGDIYSAVARRAQAVVNASTDVAATPWKNGKVVRKIAKQPTMTLCYSATVFGMQGQIAKAVRDLGGEDYLDGADIRPSCIYMAQVVWDAIGDTVVAARDAMKFLKDIARLASEAEVPIRWRSPVGFPVVQAYRETEGQQLKVHYGGQRLRLTVRKEGEHLDRRRQASGVAPNFVHSLDSAHLMATVNLGMENELIDWACIHDSFGVHACDVDTLHACIRESFIEQYTPDVLGHFREDIVETLAEVRPDLVPDIPPVPPQGTLELAAVRDSAYFFA